MLRVFFVNAGLFCFFDFLKLNENMKQRQFEGLFLTGDGVGTRKYE